MEEPQANEVIGRIKSTSIETRLTAIVEAKTMFIGFFKPDDSLAEWAKKAIIVETFYNLIREELRQSHVRIGHKQDESADVKMAKSSTPAKKKAVSSPKTADFASMANEFANFLKGPTS